MNALNLTPIEILKVEESEHDFIFTVKMKNEPQACEKCWQTDMSKVYKHGSRWRMIRDWQYNHKRAGIKIEHQRYKCNECNQTFYQTLDFVDLDSKMTIRLRDKIKELSISGTFSKVAEEFGVSHTIVRNMFNEYKSEHELHHTIVAPRVLGIDEAHLNKVMRGVFTNVDANEIIEMTETRSKKEVIKFMKSMCAYKENVKVVTCDMWDSYIEAAYDTLPNAIVVIDKFHVIRYATQALDTIRKQFRESLEDNQRRQLMRERFVLLKNKEDLSPEDIKKRNKWFYMFPTLKEAYWLKEDFRDIYKAKDRQDAEELFDVWCSCIDADFTPFLDLAKTVNNYRREIFNYFDAKYTNAFTESVNNTIKLIEKNGRGYSFDVLRAKVLFSTRATKKPPFGDGEFTPIGNMMVWNYNQMYNHTPMKPVMVYSDDPNDSFGVNISTLTEVLKNGEF